MFGFGNKEEKDSAPTSSSTASNMLSGDNTVKQWLDHPVGGALFRKMLADAGQKESVLRVVHKLPLKRLVAMSKGQFTEEIMNDMIQKANSGQAPESKTVAAPSESSLPTSANTSLPAWEEKITEGRFAGKTIIVTGAGSGIGRATASRAAREGGRIIAVDMNEERLKEFKDELPDSNIAILTADITDDEAIKRILEAAGDNIDALANVAGIMDNFTPLHEMTDETWNKVMNVNLLGMMKLSRAVLPNMLARNKGSVVNVGSEASLKASAAGTAYTTSKHAVLGLSKSMAFMYGPSGIRTNVVAPGAVLTNIEAKYESELGEERTGLVLATIPDAAEASHLAAVITYLLSDDSVNINGAVLPSDGGWSVQ